MWSYSCWWWALQSHELRWGELKADLELFNWSPQEQLCSWPSRVLLFKETDRFLSHSQSNFCSLFVPIPPLPFIANSSTWAMVKSLEMPCHAVKFSAMNQISMIGCEHIKKDRDLRSSIFVGILVLIYNVTIEMYLVQFGQCHVHPSN